MNQSEFYAICDVVLNIFTEVTGKKPPSTRRFYNNNAGWCRFSQNHMVVTINWDQIRGTVLSFKPRLTYQAKHTFNIPEVPPGSPKFPIDGIRKFISDSHKDVLEDVKKEFLDRKSKLLKKIGKIDKKIKTVDGLLDKLN